MVLTRSEARGKARRLLSAISQSLWLLESLVNEEIVNRDTSHKDMVMIMEELLDVVKEGKIW